MLEEAPARAAATEAYAALAAVLRASGGPYLLGAEASAADAAVFGHLSAVRHSPDVVGWVTYAAPTLAIYWERMRAGAAGALPPGAAGSAFAAAEAAAEARAAAARAAAGAGEAAGGVRFGDAAVEEAARGAGGADASVPLRAPLVGAIATLGIGLAVLVVARAAVGGARL